MFVLAFFALVAGAAFADAKVLKKDEFVEVTEDLDNTYAKIFNSGDFDKAVKYYSDDAILTFGPLDGKTIISSGNDEILAFLKAEKKRGIGSITITHQKGEQSAKGYILSEAELVLNHTDGTSTKGLQVQLLKKEGEQWKIYYELTTLQ